MTRIASRATRRLPRFSLVGAAASAATATIALTATLAASPAMAQSGATPAAPAREPSLTYVVKPSDKLIRLTRDMLVKPSDWAEVARFNGMKDPNFIRPAQRIDIPLRLLKSSSQPARVLAVSGDAQAGGAPLVVGASLPEGASVRTGPNSSAVLQLSDGSQVKVLPSSLAEVATSRDYAVRDASASGSTTWFSGLIRLAQGTIETLAAKGINRATPLQVQTSTSLIGVRGTQFRVAFDDARGQTSRAEVVEGQVRADNPAQQSGADLPMGTGAIINPAEREVRAVPLLPAPDLSGVPAEVSRPQSAWALPALPGAAAYRVQVAADAQFNQIVRDQKASGTSVELGALVAGNWFARVRGIDAQGIEGFDAVKRLLVREPAPTRWRVGSSNLVLADGQAVLKLEAIAPDGLALRASGYSAELATDPGMTNVIAKPSAATAQLPLGDLKPGTYYLRLRAGDQSPEGEIYRLEVPGNWGATVFEVGFALQRLR